MADTSTVSSSLTTAAGSGSDNANLSFHWADYFVFAVFLLSTAGMGVLVTFLNRNKKTDAKDFLTGDFTVLYVLFL